MKRVTLTDKKDTELIRKIEQYQTEKGLSHFVDAVRQLCNDALQLKKLMK